ncbi:hypothetical protein AAFF_G00083990 [Aldrovandia affinis]|uniref:Uncharacterized protein n=1 Tax=Aldrovandia affinis TaxID=143900 RepID=A0AAD7RWZ2_9TELE|nr:hypothetical protein AAFF_G00083990 [Aldrovandia affinis]
MLVRGFLPTTRQPLREVTAAEHGRRPGLYQQPASKQGLSLAHGLEPWDVETGDATRIDKKEMIAVNRKACKEQGSL